MSWMSDILPHWHKRKTRWVRCFLPLFHTNAEGKWCGHGEDIPGAPKCIYAATAEFGKECVNVFSRLEKLEAVMKEGE